MNLNFKRASFVLLIGFAASLVFKSSTATAADTNRVSRAANPLAPSPAVMAATDADYKRMLKALGIASVRAGRDGSHPNATNYANYDESTANPYPNLPEPLVLNNGQKVATADMWWKSRRPEIVEDFDREIYGRMPANTPKVKWEIVDVTRTNNGTVPVITKKLIGHVDNSSDTNISVNIQLTLTTPANAKGPVPVIMQLTFVFPPAFLARLRTSNSYDTGPTWQQQVLAKGWGYASLIPVSIQADNGAGLTNGIIGLCNKGQPRKPDDWGALRAWAWGAGRALDYFETDKDVDARRVGIEGHSRYGKASLVTMAYDPAFCHRLYQFFGRRRSQIVPAQFRRTGGERCCQKRIPLDGRKLY